MAEIELVARAITSIQNQAERSRKDIYLFTLHPAAGNTLYNTYHKQESIAAIGLKFDDPLMDKAVKEVETTRKAAEASKKAAKTTTHEAGAVVGVVGMIIILAGAVTIIMSPTALVDFNTTMPTAEITIHTVEVEADFTLAISTEIIRVILPTAIRVMVIRTKDSRTVRMLSNPR